MSVANKKSYQTSRMYYRSKDHKAIYMDGNFHHNIVITDEDGNYDFEENNLDKLAWHKQFDDEYIIFPHKLLVYPKEKILSCPMNHETGYMKCYNDDIAVKCGNHYFDSYLAYDSLNTIITKATKDGRILYDIQNSLNIRCHLSMTSLLGNKTSCDSGFLYYENHSDDTYQNVYFQHIDNSGNLTDTIFICNTSPGQYNDGQSVHNVFALNNYIWIYSSKGGSSNALWYMHKVSPSSGDVITTYTKIRPDGSLGVPTLHIANDNIYLTYTNTDYSVSPSITRLLICNEVFTNIFSVDDIKLGYSSPYPQITYANGKYYLYMIHSTTGYDTTYRIYSGNSIAGLNLVKSIPEGTSYTFDNINSGGTSKTFTIGSNLRVEKYYNVYKNRQLSNENNWVIFNGGFVFDNGELEINDNCFYIDMFGYETMIPSQEQIFDKYLDIQGGN